MKQTKFPAGWDADKVQRVLTHYEGQTEHEAQAEDEAGIEPSPAGIFHEGPEVRWDAFISHASEDKESFVEPLVDELRKYGLKIWFDKFALRVGSSLRESIDNGLANSRFGVVVLSHAFFAKNWPKKELNALFSRQVNGHDVILPVWHELTKNDILRYSPLLSDIVATNSSDGLVVVARALVQVIRPAAFQFETSRRDAHMAGSRMRDQLKQKFPHLDCRVTVGSQQLESPETLAVPSEPGVIASGFHEGTRVEVFALDKEAYNRAPLSFTVRMTEEGWRKLEEAQRAGKRVELGPEEIVGFSSELLELMTSRSGIVPSKLIVGPTADAARRKFRLKLTFALGQEREEFPYMEFEIVQSSRRNVVIRSSAPPMPLQLTLSFDLAGGSSSFSASYSYIGHEIRKIYKAHRALQFLMGGGTLEMVDLESDEVWPLLHPIREAPTPSDADVYLDKFIEALHEVAVGFNEKITWLPNRTVDDSVHIQLLQEIVRTGHLSIPADEITMTVEPSPGVNIEDVLQQQPILCICPNAPPDFATVFGRTLDVGRYSMIIQPRKVEVIAAKDDPRSRVVRIGLAQPLVYQFDRFRRDEPIQRTETLAEQNG